MAQGVIVVLSVGVFLTVISFSCTASAAYVNHQRFRNGEESSVSLMDEDELLDSYLPDPPVIGLRPPGTINDLVPRIDRPPIRRRRPEPTPNRSRSRFRNNFGKGKRMKRPPGPFKVVGKQKTCSYRRKLVQQPRSPYRSRSDQNRNIVYKDQQKRHGRSQVKRNLLGGGVNGQPMNYYRNLPHHKNGYYTKSDYATPRYPKQQQHQPLNPQKSMTPFYGSIKSIDHGLDLNNYRVFIHQYYDSDEPDPRLRGFATPSPHHLHPVPATSTGTRIPDLRGNNAMDNSNLLNHKTKLLTKVLPAFNAPPPSNTKSPAMVQWQPHHSQKQQQPVNVVKDWNRNQPSHRPNFDNDGGEKNKFYTSSSVIQVKEDDDARTMRRYKGVLVRQGEPTTAIKEISPPPPLNHRPENVAGKPTKQRVEESSPNEVIIGVPWVRSAAASTTSTTEHPQRATEKPTIGVIYVTPEPYTGEWTVTGGAGAGDDLRTAVTEAEIIVGHIVPQAPAATRTRTRVMNSGGHFYNNNGGGADWRPIYPTTSDIDRWFETAAVTITPNKHHWVSVVAAGKK